MRKLNTQGFTLLETMIAMTIMMIAFASVVAVQSSSLESALRSRQMNIVGMLAANAMRMTEVETFARPFSELKPEESGQFDAPYEDYTWTRTIKEVKLPNLMGLADAQKEKDPNDENQNGAMIDMIGKMMTNYLSKSLREISITINWTRGRAKQEYTVTTYWIDMNGDFQLNAN